MARRPNTNRHPNLVEQLRSATKAASAAEVKEILSSEYAEDIATALERFPVEDGLQILNKMDELQAASVLVELPTETARVYIKQISDAVLAAYLDVLPMDDAIDLQEELEPDRFESLLEVIPDEDAREIRRLMQYPKGSVGRIMTEKFFEVDGQTSMAQLLADLRTAPL